LKNKRAPSIGMGKLRRMYGFPLWKLRVEKKKKEADWQTGWSTFWRVAFMALFVWGGYELAILWHNISPESFPTEKRWLVKFAGGEIGATTYFLLISLFRRKNKKE